MTHHDTLAAERTRPALISATELADLLQISTRTLWRLRSSGKLIEPIKLGGSTLGSEDTTLQDIALLKNLNILDNILLPSMRNGTKNGAQLTEKARTLMQKTGIAGLENRDITQASGGQLQRVGICRALMGDPKIIFGDEPTGALNSTSANEIMRLLADIHRAGVTILLVTHDVKVAAKTGRVLFILDGKIAGEYLPGPYDETRDDFKAREAELTAWLAGMKF